MAIDPTRSPDVRPGAAQQAETAAAQRGAKASSPARADQVEISAEARALAEQGGVERVPFSEARVAEVAERLASGYYARPEVVREIAGRIWASGDL